MHRGICTSAVYIFTYNLIKTLLISIFTCTALLNKRRERNINKEEIGLDIQTIVWFPCIFFSLYFFLVTVIHACILLRPCLHYDIYNNMEIKQFFFSPNPFQIIVIFNQNVFVTSRQIFCVILFATCTACHQCCSIFVINSNILLYPQTKGVKRGYLKFI